MPSPKRDGICFSEVREFMGCPDFCTDNCPSTCKKSTPASRFQIPAPHSYLLIPFPSERYPEQEAGPDAATFVEGGGKIQTAYAQHFTNPEDLVDAGGYFQIIAQLRRTEHV